MKRETKLSGESFQLSRIGLLEREREREKKRQREKENKQRKKVRVGEGREISN